MTPTTTPPSATAGPNLYSSLDTSFSPIKVLLSGEPGTSKTVTSSQLAAKGKIAIINFDRNTSSLKQLPKEARDNILLVDPYTDLNGKEYDCKLFWNNFIKKLEKVLGDPEVTTIVFDSLTSWAHALHWQLLGRVDPLAKPAGFDHWSYFANHWKIFAREVLMAPDLDKHIIVIAHDEIIKDQNNGEVIRKVKLDGSMQSEFGAFFTDIWRAIPKAPVSGKPTYHYITGPGTGFAGKNSLGLDISIEVSNPETLKKLKEKFQPCKA